MMFSYILYIYIYIYINTYIYLYVYIYIERENICIIVDKDLIFSNVHIFIFISDVKGVKTYGNFGGSYIYFNIRRQRRNKL